MLFAANRSAVTAHLGIVASFLNGVSKRSLGDLEFPEKSFTFNSIRTSAIRFDTSDGSIRGNFDGSRIGLQGPQGEQPVVSGGLLSWRDIQPGLV
ncbi:MAG: hypothetical protein ACI9G1_000938 [Pirellulaceae bacterium]